jgi:hypothetical protein
VIQSLSPALGGGDGDLEILLDLILPDELI